MYDKSKIGKRIASGADRVVYRYRDTQVIKFSSLSFLIGKKMHEKMTRDYALCKKYFGDYIVAIQDVSDPRSKQYIEIQEFIRGRRVTAQDMRNTHIRSQMKDIIFGMERMQHDGYATIDLVGHSGLFSRTLNNVFVDETGALRIIDATLFESASLGGIGWLLSPFFAMVTSWQNSLLHSFLNEKEDTFV